MRIMSIMAMVQNSRTFYWADDLLPALKEAGLKFDIIRQREWVVTLEK
jgi:hypothetical protein